MLNAVPGEIIREISKALNKDREDEVTLKSFTHASGGCINNGGRLSASSGTFFLKWNSATKYPGMFEAEEKGLKLLGAGQVIRVPVTTITGIADEKAFILMEYIESRKRQPDYWITLGHQLSALHRIHHSSFGLDHDNYIGSLPQKNNYHTDWTEFFIVERLERQIKAALDNREASSEMVRRFDKLFSRLNGYFPVEKPSLIHGDLWSGNLIVDEKGDPCIIDPAVYYGHREMELSFTKLFGGYDKDFYNSYEEVFPLEPGFNDRIDLYNLYPLLVHVNLFGGGYINQVNLILKRFT